MGSRAWSRFLETKIDCKFLCKFWQKYQVNFLGSTKILFSYCMWKIFHIKFFDHVWNTTEYIEHGLNYKSYFESKPIIWHFSYSNRLFLFKLCNQIQNQLITSENKLFIVYFPIRLSWQPNTLCVYRIMFTSTWKQNTRIKNVQTKINKKITTENKPTENSYFYLWMFMLNSIWISEQQCITNIQWYMV